MGDPIARQEAVCPRTHPPPNRPFRPRIPASLGTGAVGGARTHTPSREGDFKSPVSAISPRRRCRLGPRGCRERTPRCKPWYEATGSTPNPAILSKRGERQDAQDEQDPRATSPLPTAHLRWEPGSSQPRQPRQKRPKALLPFAPVAPVVVKNPSLPILSIPFILSKTAPLIPSPSPDATAPPSEPFPPQPTPFASRRAAGSAEGLDSPPKAAPVLTTDFTDFTDEQGWNGGFRLGPC